MTGQQEADAMLQAFWNDRDRRRIIRKAHIKWAAPKPYAALDASMVGARVILWNASGAFQWKRINRNKK